MLTKEKLAETFKAVARIFPGIPSYQEREGLRAQDKLIRERLAARITEQVDNMNQIMTELTNKALLKPMGTLDQLARKLMRLSDSIRFARYGYTGLFAGSAVDEEKLAAVYEYDMSLHQDVEKLAVAVSTLHQRQDEEWRTGSLQDMQKVVNSLEDSITARESVFTGQ
jgi:hypothetical protein